ncbi:MAG TPA: serine/threonine protein kinase [Candidatus Faecimorpha stercoravium]|nr:serine/threonine protein kinase [Candidatus Faecimorpha stercoravium]
MKTPVPSWYFSGYYLQELDGIPYKLKRPFDFSFLHEYGSVFRIYDDQDSGNICFGVEKEGKRFFVKFAGAPTERYDGDREDAIERLRQTVSIYQDLRHENLVNLRAACEVGDGFAAIFDWAEGDCMGKMYPEAHQRFMQLPVEDKLRVFRDIQNFFQHVMEQGYVGIDFYDGSILYDAKKKKTTLCDIDEFQKQPFYNNMGRMWGSTRFMSPEEFQRGAPIDEITNVYTLGATAFALFSESVRTREAWPLSDRLYQVAIKAVSEDRAMRQQSIQQFREEWETGLSTYGC